MAPEPYSVGCLVSFDDRGQSAKAMSRLTRCSGGYKLARSADWTIPIKLEAGLKRHVLEAYANAVQDVGRDEETYVTTKLPRVVSRLRAQGDWLEHLAITAEALALTYFSEKDESLRMEHEGYRQILAALFYLCNPYDVIPDFDAHQGYVDDAIVVKKCISDIARRSKDVHQTFDKFRIRRSRG